MISKNRKASFGLASQGWAEAFSFPLVTVLTPATDTRLGGILLLRHPLSIKVREARLFDVAQSRSDWLYAHAAATLAFYCGMRACEIKALKWENIDLTAGVLEIRRSKTPAGWRNPTLNDVCKQALVNLYAKACLIGAANPEHHAFPWHGREQKIDPTRPITSWRTAWRSILYKAARNDEGESSILASKEFAFMTEGTLH